jgi:hypothetical protein
MTIRDINLVPADIIHGNRIKRQLLLWCLALAGSLMIIFGTYWYQSRVVLARLRPSTTLAEMHAQLGATLDEIKSAQKEIERLSMQQSILKELSVHHAFPGLLVLLADTLNARTWLTQMEVAAGDREDHPPGMRLKGYAASNELLADFLTHLARAPQVESVVLKLAREARVPGLIPDSDQPAAVVDFDITCRLKELKP